MVGSPGLVLVAKDLCLVRRIRLLERQFRLVEEESMARHPLSAGADGTLDIES